MDTATETTTEETMADRFGLYRARLALMYEHGILDQCDSPNDRDECATMRERLVAGTNAPIPACPVHGEWTEEG